MAEIWVSMERVRASLPESRWKYIHGRVQDDRRPAEFPARSPRHRPGSVSPRSRYAVVLTVLASAIGISLALDLLLTG